jgi:hypothetical protein
MGLSTQSAKPTDEYAAELVERMETAYNLTRDHLNGCAQRMHNWYDRKVRPADFKVNDTVLVY